MIHNKVFFGEEMSAELKKGIDVVYKAVSETLGASGKNVMYRSDYSSNPVTTNDGVTIARRINLEDEVQSMGADAIKQPAERTNDEAGDGTTTAIVLAHAMIEKGLEKIKGGANPMRLKKEIDESVEKVIKKIKTLSTPIKTDEELFNVVNVLMENEEIAHTVVAAVKKAGENGTVLVEESNGVIIEKEETEGLSFDKGFITPLMITDIEKMEAVLEDVPVLVVDKSFSINKDLFGLIEALNAKGTKKLFIVCENIQGEILATLIQKHVGGIFQTVAVEKPYDIEVLKDISIVTGSELLNSENLTTELMAYHVNSLGFAKKIIVTKDKTIIVGEGQKDKIATRVSFIKNEIKDSDGEYKKEQLKERLAKLVGGLVILKVGAPTEQEMKYLKLKVDDAVSAARAAVEEGIVAGGGRVLYDISLAKPKTIGEEVVFYACGQPIRKIIENSGEKP